MITISMPDILNQSIEDIREGRADFTSCMGDMPYMRNQIMPLVTTALQIPQPQDLEIPDSLWVWGVNWFLK